MGWVLPSVAGEGIVMISVLKAELRLFKYRKPDGIFRTIPSMELSEYALLYTEECYQSNPLIDGDVRNSVLDMGKFGTSAGGPGGRGQSLHP